MKALIAVFVRSWGADVVHDYRRGPVTQIEDRFDAVFDVFGQYKRAEFARQLGRSGIYVSTVPKFATLRGALWAKLGIDRRSTLVNVRSNAADLQQLRAWIAAGTLAPHVEAVYPVARAADAPAEIQR